MFIPTYDTPKVRKPGFSNLEKHDIQSITNTSPFFAVTRALNLYTTIPCHKTCTQYPSENIAAPAAPAAAAPAAAAHIKTRYSNLDCFCC
jgi:hypothetical protein